MSCSSTFALDFAFGSSGTPLAESIALARLLGAGGAAALPGGVLLAAEDAGTLRARVEVDAVAEA